MMPGTRAWLRADSQARANEIAWRELQGRTVALSTRSRHIVAERSGHAVAIDAPDLVAEAVLGLLTEASSPPSDLWRKLQ
jgi:pimeloyl-ACP methyl ester carboxylesterase